MEDQYQALYTTFRWWVPQRWNIADACCRRWIATSLDARRIAVYAEDGEGRREVWTFARLQEYANRLSNGLRRMGVQRGDRVAIVLPQRPETLVAHLAVFQMGAIAVPLSAGLASEVFEQRLRDSEARIALVDAQAANRLLPAAERSPLLRQTIAIGIEDERAMAWRTLLARQESVFDAQTTAATDPALLLYTAGVAGAPKGVLLSHGCLIGSLPGFVAAHDWFPQRGDVLWTPADWSTPAFLLGSVLPALYFGHPLVATATPPSPADVPALLERYRVTHLDLAPDALRSLLAADAGGRALALRSIATSGAPLSAADAAHCTQRFGVAPNAVYGQTETGALIGTSRDKWPTPPGSMGRPYPGHQVALHDPHGRPVAAGRLGEIVVNRFDLSNHSDPALFLGYWRGEEAGHPSSGTWHRTGDIAWMDDDGHYWFAGRIEDVIQAGRRIVAPHAVEAVLAEHLDVAQAALIQLPADGGGRLKAYLQARDASADAEALRAAVHAHARARLPAHEVPDEYDIVAALPRSVGGTLKRSTLRRQEEERARRLPPGAATPAVRAR